MCTVGESQGSCALCAFALPVTLACAAASNDALMGPPYRSLASVPLLADLTWPLTLLPVPCLQRLLASQPARRLNPSKIAESGVLRNRLVEALLFMENLALKDAGEKVWGGIGVQGLQAVAYDGCAQGCGGEGAGLAGEGVWGLSYRVLGSGMWLRAEHSVVLVMGWGD